MACSYAFTGKDGKPVLIAGKENFKAWLVENLDTAVPGWDGKAKFSFAGQNSRTSDKHALSSAQSRLDAGEDAEKVRQDTGWFKGADGKWRYEISDKDARLKTWTSYWTRLRDQGRTYDLSSILDHPRLFAAYPELKKVRVWPASDSNFAGRFNNGLAAEDDGTLCMSSSLTLTS